jgi:hypothetical protein
LKTVDSFARWATPAVFVALSACGGGGGSGNGNPSPANTAPSIQAQAFSGSEDISINGQLTASDPGDTLAYSVAANPANGAVVITAGGAFTYTPNANFNGTDTFQARVTDSVAQSATATITLTLAAVPDAVTARDDVFTVTSADSLAVLANDNDVDSAAPTVEMLGTPLVGTASIGGRGVVSLAMPAGFKGMTRFRYRVTDSGGTSSDATAVVFVGVAPFKAIFHGRPLDDLTAPMGVYVNDFVRTYRAHPPLTPGDLVQARYSANGSAIVLLVEYAATGETQLKYVEIAQPDVMRDITPRVAFGNSMQSIVVSADGRYVAYQLRNNATGADTLGLFDAQAAGMAVNLIDPAVLRQASQVQFNAANTRVYFMGKQQVSQTTSTTAVYRADLATRVVTRSSPLIPGASGDIDSFLVTPNEDRVVASRALFNGPRSVYVSNPAQPDSEVLLHEPLTSSDFASVPVMSPNGATVLMQVSHSGLDPAQVRLADPVAPGTTIAAGSVSFQQSATYGVLDRPYLMRADSRASLMISGCDTVQNPGGACDIYEIDFNSPATPARVNLAAVAGTNLIRPKYSRDGLRIAYLRLSGGIGGPVSQLQVTRRQSLGAESIDVTPADQPASYYGLDPDGYVAMVTLPNEQMSLVNLDAPLLMLPLGEGLNTPGAWGFFPR